MSSSIQYSPSASSVVDVLRIVSLPRHILTKEDVYNFVVRYLGVSMVASIEIVYLKTIKGVHYRSAFVHVTEWHQADANTRADLERAGIVGEKLQITNIQFDNGKPMGHIHIVMTSKSRQKPSLGSMPSQEQSQPSAQQLQPSAQPVQSTWMSIYIPVLPPNLQTHPSMIYDTEENLKHFFEFELLLGKVSRIDFVERPAVESGRKPIRSAYVHFEHWYNTRSNTNIRSSIDESGSFVCNGYYFNTDLTPFMNNRFLTFKINHKPIAAVPNPSSMNVHQLVAAAEALAARVSELEKENIELKTNNTGDEKRNALLNVLGIVLSTPSSSPPPAHDV